MSIQYGKADLHIHTIFSDGLMSPEALVEFVVYKTDLNVIAVTDHDTTAGARVAQAYVQHFQSRFRPLEVIIGTEVTSADGDILALFVEDEIAPGQSAAETVAAIHAQGGLAIAAHPFAHAPLLLGIDGMKGARRLIQTVKFDGVEVRNATPTEWLSNRITWHNNRRWQRQSETGGSDGHYLPTVGAAYTRFPGTSALELRRALEGGQTAAGGHCYSPLLIIRLLRDLFTRQLPTHKLPAERSTWLLMSLSKQS